MIIITDFLIIDHLISVFVTLPYLSLVFRHLLLTIHNLKFELYNLLPIIVPKNNWMDGSVDPDETPHLWRLIRVYTVCSGLSDWIYAIKYNIW